MRTITSPPLHPFGALLPDCIVVELHCYVDKIALQVALSSTMKQRLHSSVGKQCIDKCVCCYHISQHGFDHHGEQHYGCCKAACAWAQHSVLCLLQLTQP